MAEDSFSSHSGWTSTASSTVVSSTSGGSRMSFSMGLPSVAERDGNGNGNGDGIFYSSSTNSTGDVDRRDTVEGSRSSPPSRPVDDNDDDGDSKCSSCTNYSDPTFHITDTMGSPMSDDGGIPSDEEGSTSYIHETRSPQHSARHHQRKEYRYNDEPSAVGSSVFTRDLLQISRDSPDDEDGDSNYFKPISPHSQGKGKGQGQGRGQVSKDPPATSASARQEKTVRAIPAIVIPAESSFESPNPIRTSSTSRRPRPRTGAEREEIPSITIERDENLPHVVPASPPSPERISHPYPPGKHLQSSQQKLSWRMDPTQSLSDWRLEVFNRTTKTFATYHVHRVVLAVGPRACGHFQRSFSRPMANRERLTRLPLIARACNLLPHLLDYVYGNLSFELKTETAVGLAYLAHYLQQSKLLEEAMEFVHRDLSTDTMHQYLVDAIYYDQHELIDWIAHLGAQSLASLDVQSSKVSAFLCDLQPALLVQMLDLVSADDQCSPNLSTLLVEYCVYHRHEIDANSLEAWTSRLSALTSDAAVALLELDLTFAEAADLPASQLSPLQERCLRVLSQDWQSLCSMDPATLTRLVEHMMMAASSSATSPVSRTLLMEWFPNTLLQAYNQLEESQADLGNSWHREASLRDHLERALQEFQAHEAETDALRKKLEITKCDLKDQLSGWMRKQSNDLVHHQAAEQHWNQERDIWKMERQKWLEERSQLELQLYRTRAELARARRDIGNAAAGVTQDACPQMETTDIFSYISGAGGKETESWSDEKDISY